MHSSPQSPTVENLRDNSADNMEDLLDLALDSDSDDSLFNFNLNMPNSQPDSNTAIQSPEENFQSTSPPQPLHALPLRASPVASIPRQRSPISSRAQVALSRATVPSHVQKLQEIQEWYQEEISACEKQKQEAIMEIETKFYAQIGRLAMQKEQKLQQISSRFQIPSDTILLSQIPMNNVAQTQTTRPQQRNQRSPGSNTPSKRPLAQSDPSVSNYKRRRLNQANTSPPIDTEANEITRALNEQLTDAIKSNTKLWTRMLLQETIDIREVQGYVSSQGLGCGLDYLASYLRTQGIPFRKPKRNRTAQT